MSVENNGFRLSSLLDDVSSSIHECFMSSSEDLDRLFNIPTVFYKVLDPRQSFMVACRLAGYLVVNSYAIANLFNMRYRLFGRRGLDGDSVDVFKSIRDMLLFIENRFLGGSKTLSLRYLDPGFASRLGDRFVDIVHSVSDVFDTLDPYTGFEMSMDLYQFIPRYKSRRVYGVYYTPEAMRNAIFEYVSSDDKATVLDPGSGSGSFISSFLDYLYVNRYGVRLWSVPEANAEVLKLFYAVEIDPLASHNILTRVLSRVYADPSDVNLYVDDFFNVIPNQYRLARSKTESTLGLNPVYKPVPQVDAVVGNPPYTQWFEMSRETKDRIRRLYSWVGYVSSQPPSLYMWWIIHATRFLKDRGRLALVIPNNWLQTKSGSFLGRFLKRRYRVEHIVEFDYPIFQDATASAMLLLAVKREGGSDVDNFVNHYYIPLSSKINSFSEVLSNGGKYLFSRVPQSKYPDDMHWMSIYYPWDKIWNRIRFRRISDYFIGYRSNIVSLARSIGGTGANPFFFSTESKKVEWSMPDKYLKPVLTTPKNLKYFVFGLDDWRSIRDSDRECYVFICHEPRDRVPDSVDRYIRWGETECRTKTLKGVVPCNETRTCVARSKDKSLYGWYDLGGVFKAVFTVNEKIWLRPRFAYIDMDIALPDPFMVYTYRSDMHLNRDVVYALLGYLNSSINQLYMETHLRQILRGPLAFHDSKSADILIVPDLDMLSRRTVDNLASMFIQLETKTREVGGAVNVHRLRMLKDVFNELDYTVAEALELSDDVVKEIQDRVRWFVRRRIGFKLNKYVYQTI